MLENVLANAIAYLMYTMTLALALQVGIEHLKTPIIIPLQKLLKVSDDHYVGYIYVVRGVVTTVAYVFVWGGVAATRDAAPFLAFASDVALGAVTVAIVIGGESVINDAVDRLKALKEAAEIMHLAELEYVDAVDGTPIPAQSLRTAPSREDYDRSLDR